MKHPKSKKRFKQRRKTGGRRRWTASENLYIIEHYKLQPRKETAKHLDRTVSACTSRAQLLEAQKWRNQMWTKREIAYLRKMFPHKGQGFVGRKLGKHPSGVHTKAMELGLIAPHHIWTATENGYLRSNYGTMPVKAIAAHLHKSVASCLARVTKMKIAKRHREVWTDAEIATLREWYPQRGLPYVARMLGKSATTIDYKARALHLRSRYAKRRWTPAEDKRLRERFGKQSNRTIAAYFGRTTDAILDRAKTIGLAPKPYRKQRQLNPGDKRMQPMWTNEEDAALRKQYGTMPVAALVKLFNRSAVAVIHRAARLGLTHTKHWTDEENELLRRNYHHIPIQRLAVILARKPKAVAEHARIMGIARPRLELRKKATDTAHTS